MAVGQCVSADVQTIEPSLAPEAGATSVLEGCSTRRAQLEQAVGAPIAALPEEQKTAAKEHLRTQMGQAEAQIAAAIRQQRSAAAAAATE